MTAPENRSTPLRRPSRTLLWTCLVAGLLALAWGALIEFSVILGWTQRPLAPRGDAPAFAAAVAARLDNRASGNSAFVLLEDGRVVAEHFHSSGRPVDRDTLFQVASLSKWVTAVGVMTLVEDGRLDLDTPVSTYLTRWSLPDGPFDEDEVTVRRLLSHTAGLTDGLGYGGFAPGQPLQPLEESLTRARDASPGADGRTRVGAEPGGFLYSGGGYALLQLLIEEVSGEPFNAYMQRAVLAPLGMTRSTFILPDGEPNLAQSFDTDGADTPLYRFTAPAAAALYTSAGDLTRFLQAQTPRPEGAAPGRGVLAPGTLVAMRRPHARQFGVEIWGLGVILYAPDGAGDFVIGHDGSNTPAINTSARLNPATGDGIVLLETGDPRLATGLAGDWVFWNAGLPDIFSVTAAAQRAFPLLAGGWLVLLTGAIGIAVVVTLRRRKAARSGPATA